MIIILLTHSYLPLWPALGETPLPDTHTALQGFLTVVMLQTTANELGDYLYRVKPDPLDSVSKCFAQQDTADNLPGFVAEIGLKKKKRPALQNQSEVKSEGQTCIMMRRYAEVGCATQHCPTPSSFLSLAKNNSSKSPEVLNIPSLVD